MIDLSSRKLLQHFQDKKKESYQTRALSQLRAYSIWFLHLVTLNCWWKTVNNIWLQSPPKLTMIHSSMTLFHLIVKTLLIWWNKEAMNIKSKELEISMKFKRSSTIRSIMLKNQIWLRVMKKKLGMTFCLNLCWVKHSAISLSQPNKK